MQEIELQPMLGLAGGILSIIFMLVIGWARFRKIRPAYEPIFEPPAIIIINPHPHSDYPAALAGLEKAAELWRGLGHKVFVSGESNSDMEVSSIDKLHLVELYVDPTVDTASSYDEVEQGLHRHGVTQLGWDPFGNKYVRIRVMPHMGPDGLAHEIGHALGFCNPSPNGGDQHVRVTGHLMSSKPSMRDTRGLEAQ